MDTKRKINVFDIIIIIVAMAITGFFLFRGSGDVATTITVECNGDTYRYSLDTNQVISLEGAIGPTVLEIKDHSVAITKSPCTNQTCVHEGWISNSNSFIACIPGKILVTVDSQDKNEMEIDDVAH
jgi:hypothetical protein